MSSGSGAAVAAAPPTVGDAGFMAALREALARAGYAEAGLQEVRQRGEETADGRPNLAYYLRRIAEPTPLHTLVRLFVLNVGVDADQARRAFAPLDLESVLATGLVKPTARGQVHSPFALTPVSTMLLAHDVSGSSFAGIDGGHVVGVGGSARLLAATTPRRRRGRTLDLGTGCGVQALLATRHSDRVVAVDANPRALAFTTFNAALNGVELETGLGDWYDPVAGEVFDLIVCNPPYVISPEARYQFRDGGMAEDRLCAALVRRAADHLAEDGVAVVLCNWAQRDGEEWREPPTRWVDGLRCDAWLLGDETFDPLSYAAVWNRGLPDDDFADALDRWPAYLRDRGIVAVTAGVVILRRRRAARNWLRVSEPPALGEPIGEHVDRIIAAEDLLADDGGAVRAAGLRLSPDHRLEFGMRAGGGRMEAFDARLRLTRGLRSEVEPDGDVLFVLARCDGRQSVERIAAELAAARGGDVADTIPGVETVARRLLALGLVEATDPRDDAG